ncbi:hypothetical protein GOBAR_DD17519 [Gossypium barbadense]|nr:hypothetical protein GOBAR_DD17519 [Gossypium barbadense]
MASTTPLVIIIVEGTHQTKDSFPGEVLPIDKDANYQMINNYTRPKLTIITPEVDQNALIIASLPIVNAFEPDQVEGATNIMVMGKGFQSRKKKKLKKAYVKELFLSEGLFLLIAFFWILEHSTL